jgi:DNA topoisomerase II
MSNEKIVEYKKLSLHEQILLRPDTYVGSVDLLNGKEWIKKDGVVKQSLISYPECLVQIFSEVVSNSIDNVWRSTEEKCSYIKINIDKKTGETCIENDGRHVPIEKSKEGIYIPEMIFGNLLTSSNYDDTKDRKTSGRNGYGVKLCNIFSSTFSIEVVDPLKKRVYRQTWKRNMFEMSKPEIKTTNKKGHVKVMWIPDFSRFGIEHYTDDVLLMLEKKILDCAMIVSKYDVDVFSNNEKVCISSIRDYANLFFSDKPKEYIHTTTTNCKVVLMPCKEFSQVSFVNGVFTKDGGKHVDDWIEVFFRPVVVKFNKGKKGKIDISDVKRYFIIFIDCELDKPKFSSQTKTKLVSSSQSIDVKIDESIPKKLFKWEFMKKIQNALKLKSLESLDKISKKRSIVKCDKLSDANFVLNSKNKNKRDGCILCITEGDSATSYIVKGMSHGILGKKGHDYIGYLPIRGKFLNVRNSTPSKISNNEEVKSLILSLGLFGKPQEIDFTKEENMKKLRYKKLCICADSDVDGIHIVALMYNFFHTLYPSILMIDGFFNFMRTPIIKIDSKSEVLSFFYLKKANDYIEKNGLKNTKKKKIIRYLKGLGSSNSRDVNEDFSNNIIVKLNHDKNGDEMVDNIFNKSKASFRKNWILSYSPKDDVKEKDLKIEDMDISSFLNDELITFSIEDCKRSIPSVFDGLKESQRKLLFVAFKKNLNFEGPSKKVSQLSGLCVDEANYQHGDVGLGDTLIGMAQRFVFSNNIPLFFDDGSFGSRLKMGDDKAQPRYIYTKLDYLTRDIFPQIDDKYLSSLIDEGMIIEKRYYLPIIPMILVNGSFGIGTGYSTCIPQYNPIDLILWIKQWIECKGQYIRHLNGIEFQEVIELVPWVRGFKGKIKVNGNKIITEGVIEKNKTSYKISELPFGKRNLSIEGFEKVCNELLENKKIKMFQKHSTDNKVDFDITPFDNFEVTIDSLKLSDCLFTSNMVLFYENSLKKYESVNEIMDDFCKKRLQLYNIRKNGEISELEMELKILNNKIRFIRELNDETLIIKNQSDEQVHQSLSDKKFDKVKDSFNYLLDMNIRGLTKSKIENMEKEKNKIEESLKVIRETKIEDMWISELDKFKTKYLKWLINVEMTSPRKSKKCIIR